LLVVGEVVRMAKPAALYEQFAWEDLVSMSFAAQIEYASTSSVLQAGQERGE
jgi:hypothetical protein